MKMIFVVFVTALSVRAGSTDGVELNARGLESYRNGQYKEAETFYRRAIEALPPDQRLSRILAQENLGMALSAQGRGAEAREMLENLLREIELVAGPNSLEMAKALSNLAVLYWSGGNLPKAEPLSARAESLFAGSAESEGNERAKNRQVLASVYLGQHRYQDAIKLLNDSINLGDERTKATSYGNLAAASIGIGEMAEAEAYAHRGLALADRSLPAAHPGRAVLLNNLAQACRFSGKYVDAEKYYRDALAIWETAFGPSHPDVGRGLMNLAAFYHERGREAGAEQLYRRAAKILETADPALVLVIRNELADVLRAESRYVESEKLARPTLREMEGTLTAGDPRLVRARMNWAKLLSQTRRPKEAASVMEQVAKSLR